MIEVEIKLPVDDLTRIKEFLIKEGFTGKQLLREEDHYFDSASGQIRKGGEALRIRITEDLLTGNVESLVTFKGKKTDQVSMTRKELETEVADADVIRRIFGALGYEEVMPFVIKIREELVRGQMNACLDRVEGLGAFLELEIVQKEGEDSSNALAQIEEVLSKMGYKLTDTIRTSYLTLLQKKM